MTRLSPLASQFRTVMPTLRREYLAAGLASPDHVLSDANLLKLLNDAMAAELVSMLRNRSHHFVVHGIHSPDIAQNFLDHANEDLSNADQFAARIVQLGGTPDFSPDQLIARSHARHAEGHSLSGRLRENMTSKRLAIDAYRGLIRYLNESDPITLRLLNDLVEIKERQGDELAKQMVALHLRRQVRRP